MGVEVYPFRDTQVVDFGDIACTPFNIHKVRKKQGRGLGQMMNVSLFVEKSAI